MAGPTDFADDMLAELVLASVQGRPFSRYALDWLAKGVLRSIRGGKPLQQELSLAGSGIGSLRRRLLLIRRDEYLALAAQAVAVDDSVDMWERCVRLAPLLKRFELRKWRKRPDVQALPAPPQTWEAWEQHAFRAFKVGEGVPLTAKGLHKRLNSTPPCSVSGGAAKVLSRFI